VKNKHEIKGLAGQRGYTSFGKEHAKHSDVADLKEFFQIGQTVSGALKMHEEYPDNVNVKERPDFLPTAKKLYREFEKAGADLLRAIALYLNQDEDYFDGPIDQGNSILRAIHYPPITEEPESAIRAEQHEDINLITLLVGASASGLQVLDKNDNWVPVLLRGMRL
jgi:isopenicillin N synthase-like dioxygenase